MRTVFLLQAVTLKMPSRPNSKSIFFSHCRAPKQIVARTAPPGRPCSRVQASRPLGARAVPAEAPQLGLKPRDWTFSRPVPRLLVLWLLCLLKVGRKPLAAAHLR